MSKPTATLEVDDHDLVGQADWVIGGDAGRTSRRQAWYAAYVTALIAGTYGFPLVQAVVATADPAALRSELASPVALVFLVAAVAAVLGAMRVAGTHRGPVVPPLPWIDHVVTAPIDRPVAVGRWWRLSLGLCVFMGALLGATVGAGVAFARLTSWYAAGLATLTGAALGWVGAVLWLRGQVRSLAGRGGRFSARRVGALPTGARSLLSSRSALRELHIEVLRRHAANSSTIGGSVLAGNLRTARLSLARPVRHARGARLRAGSPFVVVVRRDILGLRRLPAALWTGLGLMILAAIVVAWTLTTPVAPPVAMTIGLVPGYLGFGAWAEGLRLQADNLGTPSLLGISARAETLAHLAVPCGLTLVGLSAGVALAGWWAGSGVSLTTAALVVVLTALLAGGHLLAAFRGSSPASTLRADASGPMMLVGWYLMPLVVVLGVGTVALVLVRNDATGLLWSAGLAAAVGALGLSRAQRLGTEHRV